jgi:uncharacterized protein YndB with AHSA1/START domain
MNEALSAHEVTIERVFDAPRELVWKAWTEPEQLAQWFGPRGWTTPPGNVTIEPRPGGTFRVTQVSGEGEELTTHGVYREVVEPERLVLAERSEDSWHEGAESVLTLTDLGDGRTQMVLRTTIHTTDEMRAQAEAGMRGSVDRLAAFLG